MSSCHLPTFALVVRHRLHATQTTPRIGPTRSSGARLHRGEPRHAHLPKQTSLQRVKVLKVSFSKQIFRVTGVLLGAHLRCLLGVTGDYWGNNSAFCILNFAFCISFRFPFPVFRFPFSVFRFYATPLQVPATTPPTPTYRGCVHHEASSHSVVLRYPPSPTVG